MEIKVLYFDGCPSWQKALINLQKLINEENLDFLINLVEVKSDKEALKYKFLGSPSFQVNGQDLWPENRENFSMSCRVYSTSNGLFGVPTDDMLRAKLIDILNNKDKSK